MLSSLLEEIKRSHFPNPPASAQTIEEFEQTHGWPLDDEMRAFYLAFNGARLFRQLGAPYSILPLEKIIRVRVAITGEDSDEWGSASLYALCDVQDGSYIAFDTSAAPKGPYPLIDCFYDTFPNPDYLNVVAPSFSAFLEKALRSAGRLYWLQERT